MGARNNTLDFSRRRAAPDGAIATAVRSKTQPIEAVVFEMGGVLYDDTAWPRWLLMLLARMGLHTQYESFYRVWRRDHQVDVDCGRRDYWEVLRDFLRSAGMSSGQIDEVEAAGHFRREKFDENVRPFPGVPAVISSLRARGVRLAVLSNSGYNAHQLHQRLGRMGIAQQFETVISSRDLCVAKPSAACYQAVLDALHLRAAEVALVSHDASDLAGARSVGMATFAIHHDADAIADHFLDRLDQLLTDVPTRGSQSLAS